jgi:hypothetical protein
MTRWYVTLYKHSWGRGETPEDSKRQARKAGGSGNHWFTARLPEGIDPPWVDGLGGINWKWTDGEAPDSYDPSEPLPIVAAGRGCPKDIREQVKA